jgi:pimeloyl-ACP methyl ester carboxylesterase
MNELMTHKNIYLISGLGADERIFNHLNFGALTPKYIKWIVPKKNELMEDYAARISEQIDAEKPILLGVSFGGMLAIEIAKLIDCQQVIIISSAKTRNDIPLIYRIFGQLKMHKLIPIQLLKQPNFITYWCFGMYLNDEKKLLKSILKETDTTFLKWAINAIINWKNETTLTTDLIQIHGDLDRILPIKNKAKIDLIIPKGGHLMVYNKADLINDFLRKMKF